MAKKDQKVNRGETRELARKKREREREGERVEEERRKETKEEDGEGVPYWYLLVQRQSRKDARRYRRGAAWGKSTSRPRTGKKQEEEEEEERTMGSSL